METRRPLLAAAFLAAALAGCQPAPAPSVTIAGQTPYGQEGLTVTGKAVIRANPDLAILRLGYTVGARTAQDARKLAQGAIQNVILAIQKQGVEPSGVQTTSFHLSQAYDYERKARRWEARTMLEVRVRDVDRSGEVLDAAMGAGANQVQGIEYTIESLERLRARAREEACRVAKAKADQFAKTLGAKLGRPVAIREYFGDEDYFRRARNANAQWSAKMPAAEARYDYDAVAPGTVGVELTVEVVYGLQQ